MAIMLPARESDMRAKAVAKPIRIARTPRDKRELQGNDQAVVERPQMSSSPSITR